MKKLFTLLSLVMLMFAVNANAQDRKTWDFTKGVSDETRALLDNDGANWQKVADSEGVSTAWISSVKMTGELKAGGQVIKEFSGLQFGDFGANNAIQYFGTKLRLQKACSVALPALSKGQKITIKAQSANPTAADRGFYLNGAEDATGSSSFIVPGSSVEGAPAGGITIVEATTTGDGVVTIQTGLSGVPNTGIEILSIIIDEGDKNIKKWDFSAFSAATVAQVCGAADWTTKESDSKDYITGNEIRWIGDVKFDANEDLTAAGTAIKELKGLRHTGLGMYGMALAFDYATTLDNNKWGPYYGPSYLWVTGTASKIVVPNVKAGSVLKLGVESHKPGDNRGFSLSVNGTVIVEAKKTADYDVLSYDIPAGDDEYIDVEITATKGCHLYSIEAEVKDEAVVDKNVELGNPAYSIKEGMKISTNSEKLTITFPKRKNLEGETEIELNCNFGPADGEGEAVEASLIGTVGDGLEFIFGEYLPLQESTTYKFYITSIAVEGHEELTKEGDELFPLTFVTNGPGITTPREWNFAGTTESAELIKNARDAGAKIWNTSSKGRYALANPQTYAPLTVDGTNAYPQTEGLLFSMSTANDILVGTPKGFDDDFDGKVSDGSQVSKLILGGGSPSLIIPDCSAGDEITIKISYNSGTNGITIENGLCDGANTIAAPKNAGEYKIIASENGDVVLKSKAIAYYSIKIFPSSIKKEDISYTINATNAEGTVLAKLSEGQGVTNDKVNVGFPYYILATDGELYTNGTRGAEFNATVTLENGQTEYGVEYKKASIDGMKKPVFYSEAEELDGTMESTTGNVGIRASNKKVAYPIRDIEICTLPAGTYKVKALIWNGNKSSATTINLKAGEQAIDLESTSDNMSEVYSEAFTVEAPTTLTWLQGESLDENHGLDGILVYEFDETLSGIEETVATSAAAKVVKVLKNGQLVIVKGNKQYNAAGAQIK